MLKRNRIPLPQTVLFILLSILFVLFSSSSTGDLNKKRNKLGIVYWHGDTTSKMVALTFDDGPNEPYTYQIVEILKKYNIKATFFMLGNNVETYPNAAKTVFKAGHVIGNHSYNHPNLIFDTNAVVRQQIIETENIIYQTTGYRTWLFRPPFGGDDPLTFEQAEKYGYSVIKWSLSSKDWERPGVAIIVQNVLDHVQNGSIILMHDGNEIHHGFDRTQTVAALPEIIIQLKKRGYNLVTIPELLNLKK